MQHLLQPYLEHFLLLVWIPWRHFLLWLVCSGLLGVPGHQLELGRRFISSGAASEQEQGDVIISIVLSDIQTPPTP